MLDAFFGALSDNLEAPAPSGLAPQDAEVARTIVALDHAVPEPEAEATARIWTRVLESVPAASSQQPSTVFTPPITAPARLSWRPRGSRSWVARAAAILLLVVIGGTALGLSPQAQAQVRRLA